MKSLELALKAGRLWQNPVTHFVHHSFEHPEKAESLIPIYENFCFALTLFRTKTADHVLEGKALLERLFAFQTEEGFPIYLHEYPVCKSRKHGERLSVIAQFLLNDFSNVLGADLRAKLERLIVPLSPFQPKTPEDWAELLVRGGVTDDITFWDPIAHAYVGAQRQDQGEPAVTLLDLIMGEITGQYSQRALKCSPVHLLGSLIYPMPLSISSPSKMWKRQFWGDKNKTHSALLETGGNVEENGDAIVVDLPEKEVQDEMEVSYWVSRDAEIRVNGVKATTFQPGDVIEIRSGSHRFEIIWNAEGKFWGHIHMGNRPGQISSNKFEAYDWKISLRTIERTKPTRVKMDFRL